MSGQKRSAVERFADEEFDTPETTGEAYNVGKMGAFHGHGRMSHEQFFRYDSYERPFGTTPLYRAYRKGFDEGQRMRRAIDEKRALAARGS